jgi:hypothetical protein
LLFAGAPLPPPSPARVTAIFAPSALERPAPAFVALEAALDHYEQQAAQWRHQLHHDWWQPVPSPRAEVVADDPHPPLPLPPLPTKKQPTKKKKAKARSTKISKEAIVQARKDLIASLHCRPPPN